MIGTITFAIVATYGVVLIVGGVRGYLHHRRIQQLEQASQQAPLRHDAEFL